MGTSFLCQEGQKLLTRSCIKAAALFDVVLLFQLFMRVPCILDFSLLYNHLLIYTSHRRLSNLPRFLQVGIFEFRVTKIL